MKRKRGSFARTIYTFAITWAVLAFILPLYKIAGIIITTIVALIAAIIAASAKKKPKKKDEPAREQTAEEIRNEQVDAIVNDGRRALGEMGRLYGSINNTSVRTKINEIMRITDKIIQDAKADPSDVPQIKKFMNYYLPTTIKLLNAYDRMDTQGIDGENLTKSKQSIEEMLDTAIEAYQKRLDSLFEDQALDIETDIQVLNTMLSREGLVDNKENKLQTKGI